MFPNFFHVYIRQTKKRKKKKNKKKIKESSELFCGLVTNRSTIGSRILHVCLLTYINMNVLAREKTQYNVIFCRPSQRVTYTVGFSQRNREENRQNPNTKMCMVLEIFYM